MPATLAALESALATGAEAEWLAQLSDEEVREQVQRALQADRKLWTQYPDSLGSCLLARTFGVKALASLHRAWSEELAGRGRPWIRPLRQLPVEVLPLAELESAQGLSLGGLHVPRFVTDDELLLTARRYHPTAQQPEPRRKERLRWRWAEGRASVEPEPPGDEAAAKYPQFVSDGWGPTYLIRAEGAPRVALPCPDEGSAFARWSADGSRLIVYGTHDEYAGGFVYVVHPETLAVERKLEVDSPVSRVADGGGQMVVSTSRSGTVGWVDGRKHVLPIFGYEFALSPSGKYVATFAGALKIWSLAELVRHEAQPPEPGFPPRFDPSGDRLLCDRELLDGRTGQRIARLKPELGPYLEGGPPQPWLYFGTRVLICTHGGLQLWDARSGKPLKLKTRLGFSQRDTLAFDREGSRLAALVDGQNGVTLHELPHGRLVRTLGFELAGATLGMAEDGSMLVVQQGAQVEVRTADGALVRRCGSTSEAVGRRGWHDPAPRFSRDGRRVAARVGEGWRIWTLASGEEERVEDGAGDDLTEVADFAGPRPAGWKLAIGRSSVFTHEASGTTIALPVSGGWQFNPADPRICICNELLAVLEG
ncbi:WD40 repeat domain-containing protein [Nannocystis pusilla]|uniref:WD40 repeat domain-containing protein n=1 Tax=Nannocystis pusilla TaxID=889268 RepID=UPI003DA3FB20